MAQLYHKGVKPLDSTDVTTPWGEIVTWKATTKKLWEYTLVLHWHADVWYLCNEAIVPIARIKLKRWKSHVQQAISPESQTIT